VVDLRRETNKVPTLFDWAGGAEAFERLFQRFYDHVSQDELIGPLFAHMDQPPQVRGAWLGEVFGGRTCTHRPRAGTRT